MKGGVLAGGLGPLTPERFGVPELEGDRVLRTIEKPLGPSSPYAAVGVYRLRQSGEMSYGILDGWWMDAGTFESPPRANQPVAERERRKAGRP